MQSPVSRAFSVLSSKIHPQLPLTPRESQQLLALLTTSFRQHLDREHPGYVPDDAGCEVHRQHYQVKDTIAKRSVSEPTSSHITASKHLESILTNPLFAIQPRRRRSGISNSSDMHKLLKDPLQWFLEQVADGSADITKALLCMEALERTPLTSKTSLATGTSVSAKPGLQIVEWLRASGLDRSKPFLTDYKFVTKLARLLTMEHEESLLWDWFLRRPADRMKETGMSVGQVRTFRSRLLRAMVKSKLDHGGGLEAAFSTFFRALSVRKIPDISDIRKGVFGSGMFLMKYLVSHPNAHISPEAFNRFLHTTDEWAFGREKLVRALLWLHHPSGPSVSPGLDFLKHYKEPLSNSNIRVLLVQLSLGVARQLLIEERFEEGRQILDFAKENFPEEVGSQPPQHSQASTALEPSQDELENMQLLDSLRLE
ncbi:hypothetical protein K432DRAFT_285034 [Lepidopterella palustris CBS 459.81]|uniref:Uncharacterized protein n=1 Tax=Lepidopterella palustris CBS 459.81 TaxID=1314670 RepID=A0A8E2EMK6_9PEZI|nr:hypothetical protein K432DRAFT_285034 [Lepidopterella palustris CBS 459.81]